MKKTTLFLLFLLFGTYNSCSLSAQNNTKAKKIGVIHKKDSTSISGNVKNFHTSPTFEKIDPLVMIKSLYTKNLPNYFSNGIPFKSNKNVNIKPNEEKKFIKIPFEEIDRIEMTHVNKKNESKTTEFKAFEMENFYGKKREKTKKLFLPSLKKGKTINLYGTIYPYRSIIITGPFLFETQAPIPIGVIYFENSSKNLVLSNNILKAEKKYTLNKAERRAKRKNNINHNSLMELFGDCPETLPLIEKFYIKRLQNTDERKKLAIEYNERLRKNVKNFKKIMRQDRKKITPELYMQTYEFDILEIINTYEKFCVPIDEFDPRHELYKKEFDIINRDKI